MKHYTLNTSYLTISNTIPIHDDTVGKFTIDLMVFPEGGSHTHLQVVQQLLASVLKHALGVVPEEGGGA